jgi:outer membrane protein assembly factor BamB
MFYVDFEAEPPLRWRSDPLGEGATYIYNPITASASIIFMSYDDTLVAFDRDNGSILWQQTTSDEVSNICQDCLQIFENRVVALTADGMLTGYDINTGQASWTVRLNETTRQLLNLDGKVGVLDKEEDMVGINVYESQAGTRVGRIEPQCPNEIFPNSPQTLGVYDPVLLSDDAKNLYVPISDYDPGCLQNLDTATLAGDWEASIPRDILDNLGWDPYLITDEMLYLTDGHNLHAISLLDGSYQTVHSDEDHNMIPLSEENGILLVLAERTRGTSKYSLWGFKPAAQSKLWEFTPSAEEIIDDIHLVVHDGGIWGAYMAAGTPILIEAFQDPGEITFSRLDSEDGSIIDQNPVGINQNDYSYLLQVIDWQGERVALAVDSRILWIDAPTGTLLAGWPTE